MYKVTVIHDDRYEGKDLSELEVNKKQSRLGHADYQIKEKTKDIGKG